MKLKKSLGQNFFNNPTLATKIVNLVATPNPTNLLEIGPGDGYFTNLLTNLVQNVTVIEKDTELANNLEIKFPKITIYNEDFLDFDLRKIPENTIVFGSLPYNVSKAIIRLCIESKRFSDMFFIIQKEVGQKYAGIPNSSALSIMTKLYVDTKVLFDISPGSFIPRPKVTSSFIHMKPNQIYNDIDTKKVEAVIKQAFRSPRKTLKNNLKGTGINLPPQMETLRPEQLALSDFLRLV